ncbi:hypothetical protein [Kordia sp.]|uniref:hypothetical protein n=1 Tax=Kordia sp. TaxID=1965332 RepID=UPI003B5A90EE
MGALIGFSLTNMLAWDTSVEGKLNFLKEFQKKFDDLYFNERITDYNLDENNLEYRSYWKIGRTAWEIATGNAKDELFRKYDPATLPDFFSNYELTPISISNDDWINLDSVNIFMSHPNVMYPDGKTITVSLDTFSKSFRINHIEWGIVFLENMKKNAPRGQKKPYGELIKIFKMALKHKLLICISDS